MIVIFFAFMHFNMKRYFYDGYGHHSGSMIMREYHGGNMMGYGPYENELDRYSKMTPEERKKYFEARKEILRVYSKYEIEISKKQL